MRNIPDNTQVFLDTNIFLYAITEHPRFGLWCNALLDRSAAPIGNAKCGYRKSNHK